MSEIIIKATPENETTKPKITYTYDNPIGQSQIHAAAFMNASVLFRGCDLAWQKFCKAEPDATWGNNSYTLVPPIVIVNALTSDYDGSVTAFEIGKVNRRIQALPPGIFINLEG